MSHYRSQNGWALGQAGIEFPLVLTKILITAVVTFYSLTGLSVEGFLKYLSYLKNVVKCKAEIINLSLFSLF